MLSRTTDHLYRMARSMERAGQTRSAWGAAHDTAACECARCVFGLMGARNAV